MRGQILINRQNIFHIAALYHGSQPDTSAKLGFLFIQGYVVPAQRGHASRFHARRAAADDHDFFLPDCGAHVQFPVPAQRRVHAADTRLGNRVFATGAAGTAHDILKALVANLVGKFWIGPEGTAQPDDVGVALIQDALGKILIHAPGGNNRHMNHLFDIAGGIGPKPLVTVDIHVRFHEVFRLGVGEIVGAIAKRHGTVTVPGHVEELCPGGLKCLSIFQGFFEGNAFFGSVFTAVHADAENKIGTAALAGFLQDFSDDASTVFHILAAVFVIPAVPHAADKAVEKVAVRRMNLHAVEAALVRADDGLDNSLPHFVNLADAEAAAGVSVGRGHGNFVHVKRGRRYGQLAEARPGGRAGVMELRKNLASVRLNTPGQFLKAGNESVVIKPEIDAGRVFNGATAHNDRGRASFGNVFRSTPLLPSALPSSFHSQVDCPVLTIRFLNMHCGVIVMGENSFGCFIKNSFMGLKPL